MNNLEKRIDAMCAVLIANTAEERRKAVEDLKLVMVDKISKPKDEEGVVRDILLYLGVPDHLNGYEMAVHAVVLCLQDRKYLDRISDRLYPALAEKFDTTNSRAERAIRHLIRETFSRGNITALDKVFGSLVSVDSGKVTNSEFIGRMVNVTKQRLRGM